MYIHIYMYIYIYIHTHVHICYDTLYMRTVFFVLRMVLFVLRFRGRCFFSCVWCFFSSARCFFFLARRFVLPRTLFFLLRKVFWNTYGSPGTGEQGFDPGAGIEKKMFQICETFINSGETLFKHRPRLHLYENLQK